MPRHRRAFTPEYRVTAAHMVIDAHRRIAEVARELNVDTSLLHTWVRDERLRMSRTRGGDGQRPDAVGEQPLSVRERAELLRLRQTVAEQANEIALLDGFSNSGYNCVTGSRKLTHLRWQ
jgi:transposase